MKQKKYQKQLKLQKHIDISRSSCIHTPTHTYLCTCAFAAIVIPFLCLCRRCNNYGTTPTLQAAARGAVNGNNNIPPATPTSQIFCLHGRSNNVEVDGKFTSSRWWSVKSGRGRRPVVSGAGVGR